MALINIQRFRDVLVRSRVAAEAPALEVSVGLDRELAEAQAGLATKEDVRNAVAVVVGQIRQSLAEYEQSAREREVRFIGIMLGGLALAIAILGIVIAVT